MLVDTGSQVPTMPPPKIQFAGFLTYTTRGCFSAACVDAANYALPEALGFVTSSIRRTL